MKRTLLLEQANEFPELDELIDIYEEKVELNLNTRRIVEEIKLRLSILLREEMLMDSLYFNNPCDYED